MAVSSSKLFSSVLLLLLAFNAAITFAHEGHAEADALHPLPRAISMAKHSSKHFPRQAPSDRLRRGGWLLRFEPTEGDALDGTLRVEKNSTSIVISGDLYKTSGQAPDPAAGIPILPRDAYANYIRATSFKEGAVAGTVDLGFEMYKFKRNTTTGRSTWENLSPSGFSITLAPGQTEDIFSGELKRTDTGAVQGTLSATWASKFFRKLTVELDAAPDCAQPVSDDAGHDWHNTFATVDWDINVDVSDTNVAEPTANGWWTDAQLHDAMLKYRSPVDFDKEWRVHVLSVKHLNSTERGLLYDTGSARPNTVPREGIAIAAKWVVGTLNSGRPDGYNWGTEAGKIFDQAKSGFLRTAIHEVGHALSLQHQIHANRTNIDTGFMTTSPEIADQGNRTGPLYPENISWKFSDIHTLYLRHLSDVVVRPGFANFGTANVTWLDPKTPVDIAKRNSGLRFGAAC